MAENQAGFLPTQPWSEQTPLSEEFLSRLRAMERAYLMQESPLRQCGFSGSQRRWETQRRPIVQAIEGDGDLLNLGCANGYLLESLVKWTEEKEIFLTPHGLDAGKLLIEQAQKRMSLFSRNFYIGNAWDWVPPRQYLYVYTSVDLVPPEFVPAYLKRIGRDIVADGGRLIVGSYGSRSRQQEPMNLRHLFDDMGWATDGMASAPGGPDMPVAARFIWRDF